jgi:WD40 repeat protein
MSPEGTSVAIAGNVEHAIFIYSRVTGRVTHRITVKHGAVISLVFNSAGDRLAAGFVDQGFSEYRVSNGAEIVGVNSVGKGRVFGLTFLKGDNLIAACDNGKVGLYDVRGGRSCERIIPELKPERIALSPDGKRLAIGSQNSANVVVLSVPSLATSGGPKQIASKGEGHAVSWSMDGKFLYAARDGDKMCTVRRWKASDFSGSAEVKVTASTIYQLVPSSDGGVLFAAADAWGSLDASSHVRREPLESIPFRGTAEGKHFLVSEDGWQVAFPHSGSYRDSFRDPAGPQSFSFQDRSVHAIIGNDFGTVAKTSDPSVQLTNWKEGTSPILNGKVLNRPQIKIHSLAISPSGERFIFGMEYSIECYSKAGDLMWELPAQGQAWAVNIPLSERVVVVTLGDGTVRWLRLTDGKPLVSLFLHPDGRRWVAWTESGYYDCSGGGDSLVGWSVVQSQVGDVRFYPASGQRSFFRPDVIQDTLRLFSEEDGIYRANKVAKIGTDAVLSENLPPIVKIQDFREGEAKGECSITYSIDTPDADPVTEVHVIVNGRLADAPQASFKPNPANPNGPIVVKTNVHAKLSDDVSVVALNSHGQSDPAKPEFVARVGPDDPDGPTPRPSGNLIVLTVGIGHYKLQSLASLPGAPNDAVDLAKELKFQKGRLYSDVKVQEPLCEKNATADQILKALTKLQSIAKQDDTVLVSFSGHGSNADNEFSFLPYNFDPESPMTAIPGTRILEKISKIKAKAVILLMDACHSGDIVNSGYSSFVRQARSDGRVVVFSACQGNGVACEPRPREGEHVNGYFTKAMLEIMDGKWQIGGSPPAPTKLTVRAVDKYVYQRVFDLSKGNQETDCERGGDNFVFLFPTQTPHGQLRLINQYLVQKYQTASQSFR